MGDFNDIAINTYQYTNGQNQTTVMYNQHWKVDDDKILTFGAGIDTNWQKSGFIADGKFGIKLAPHTGLQLRVRTRHGEDYNTTQARLAISEGYRFKEIGTSIYVTPYGALNIDYNKQTVKPNLGVMFGVTKKIGNNIIVGVEGQRYNLQDINEQDGNWSINGTLVVKI